MSEVEVEKPKDIIVDEEHMLKHRRMKRTLVQFINRHKESLSELEDAIKKIKVLQKKNRKLKRKLKKSENEIGNSQTDDDDNDSEDNSNDDDSVDDSVDDDDDSEDSESSPEIYELDSDDNEYTEKMARSSRRDRSGRERTGGDKTGKKRRRGPALVDVKRNEGGQPILPIQHGLFNIISLGVINYEDPNFHNERYIFPVGYTVERTYSSMVDPNHQTEYLCKVLADSTGPLFTIIPKDDPDTFLSGRTPTSCWGMVIRAANKVRNKSQCRNAISGPEYFGFTNPLIRHLIEGLEDVDKCKKYVPYSN
ncbi:unnamed protein product [Cunninghamella blakesleeana]